MTLKRIRLQKGLTQRALAAWVGVTQPYIVMLEMGKRTNPSLQLLQRLAKALAVPLGDFLEGRRPQEGRRRRRSSPPQRGLA